MAKYSRIPIWCLVSAVLILSTPFAFSQDSEDSMGPPVQVAGELELEKAVAERLEALLQPLVGELVVLVDLDLTSLQVELEGFTYSESESLPGLPVTVSENVRQLGGSGWNYNEIGGISVRVFVADSMKDEQINRITELIPLWINLNYTRGDQIIVERVPFVNPPLTMVGFLLSKRGVIILSSSVLLLAIFVTVLLRAFTRPARLSGDGEGEFSGNITGPMSAAGVAAMISEMTETKTSEAEAGDPTGSVMTNMLSLPEGAVSVKLIRENDSSNRAIGSLAKLQDLQFTDLQVVLKKADPTTAAIALNLSRPTIAAEYLTNLDNSDRREILKSWNELDTISTGDAQSRAADLRQRIDSLKTSSFTTSGPEPLADLINQSPERIGKAIFNDIIKVNKSLSDAVRSRVFFLDDILETSSTVLRKAIMSMPRDLVAILVRDADEEVQERIFSNLSQRAANLVREEASILSSPPPEKAAMAKRMLVDSIHRFNSPHI